MIESRFAYAIMMVVATLVAAWFVSRHQRSLAISSGDRWAILASAFVGATFAAKLPFLLFGQWQYIGWTSWLGDGKTLLWGLAGGYAGVEISKSMLGIRTRTGDTFVVGVASAISLGRIGCLLFGCCYGSPTDLPWGIAFEMAEDGGTLLRHPTQIYESIFHAGFAVVASIGISRLWISGNWMPVYLLTYCCYRFGTEWIRPEPRLAAGFTFYQWSAIFIALAMSAILIHRRRGSVIV